MNVTGIIAEYNPFHLGHLHQITYVREKLNSDYIIVAMSGDFVQRGTPALLSKYTRAEAALLCGADLVLELPVQVSSASAEFFAGGAVSLLNGLGVVDQLCFGSEEGTVEGMQLTARILNEEPQGFRDLLKNSLKQGMSFPAARSQALGRYLCTLHSLGEKNLSAFSDTLLSSPNNILGIEYCRALLRLHSSIKPATLKREGSGYHDLALKNNQAPSASAVRAFLSEQSGRTPSSDSVKDFSALENMLPAASLQLLKNAFSRQEFLTENDLDLILHYCLTGQTSEELSKYADVSPDLAARIINCLNDYRGFCQFTELLKTKELTHTRIQRALLHILLQIRETPKELSFGRVLGFRKSASPLLKEIKKRGTIPLVTKPSSSAKTFTADKKKLLDTNTAASNIYESLICHKTGRAFVHEYQKQMILIP